MQRQGAGTCLKIHGLISLGRARVLREVIPRRLAVVSRTGSKRALLITGDPEEARVIGEMLRRQGAEAFALACVESVGEAERYVASHAVDVILVDGGAAGSRGQEIALRMGGVSQRVSMVQLLSAATAARQAVPKGAQDYLI